MTHPAALDPDRLLADCAIRFTRRSGPGGQNRNKVETAVVLTHRPTGQIAEASERRSQEENRRVALFRLRLALALRVRTPPQGEPSSRWQSRCRGGRLAINPLHDDYPALLAEALDQLAASDWNLGPASDRLGCTSSQIVKLLAGAPEALMLLNAERQARGLRPLRSGS